MLINETTGQILRQQTAICLQQDVQENDKFLNDTCDVYVDSQAGREHLVKMFKGWINYYWLIFLMFLNLYFLSVVLSDD